MTSSPQATYFTSTILVGNAIHFGCHTKAGQANQNHPNAPKSKREGVSLQTSHVNCNAIVSLIRFTTEH
jgi:hypothetical protein